MIKQGDLVWPAVKIEEFRGLNSPRFVFDPQGPPAVVLGSSKFVVWEYPSGTFFPSRPSDGLSKLRPKLFYPGPPVMRAARAKDPLMFRVEVVDLLYRKEILRGIPVLWLKND